MSQSDYLKHKKTAHILKENKLPPILNSADYTAYTRFQLTNTIINDEETNYGEIVPEGKKKIFGSDDLAYSYALGNSDRLPVSLINFLNWSLDDSDIDFLT